MAIASLFVLATYLSHIHTASIPASLTPLSNTTSLSTAGSPINDWDPDFEIVPIYRALELRPVSVYMNTIDLLATLAHASYYGQTPYTRRSLASYADVAIEIRPRKSAISVQTRIVEWCVYGSVCLMKKDGMFRDAVFDCILRDVVLVSVVFEKQGGSGGQMDGSEATGSLASRALLGRNGTGSVGVPKVAVATTTRGDVTDAGVRSLDADFELTMTFSAGGGPLSREDVFWTVMATLQAASKYDDRDIVHPFEMGVPAYPCRIHMEAADESAEGLNGPPSFDWKWVIETARQIPDWMFEHKFWESFFTVDVNGYVIGKGMINKIRQANTLGSS